MYHQNTKFNKPPKEYLTRDAIRKYQNDEIKSQLTSHCPQIYKKWWKSRIFLIIWSRRQISYTSVISIILFTMDWGTETLLSYKLDVYHRIWSTKRRKANIFWYIVVVLVVTWFECCPIMWFPCCDVRYDFRIKTMVGSSLPPVVRLVYPVCRFLWIVHFLLPIGVL